MRRILVVLLLTVALAAQPSAAPRRPVSTYSIVAHDPRTGQLGVAVQSHWFCVGCNVIWAEAGVGAVATQSFIDPSYGELGLDIMRVGRDAPDALRGLLVADDHREIRQVAMIDVQGHAAAWTGEDNIQAAGHAIGGVVESDNATAPNRGALACGENYSVQANLMTSDKVWPAMARAFEHAKGDLAERMLTALETAQSIGGDERGKQSAALVVVRDESTDQPWIDTIFDLRVDDDPRPLKELRRLLTLARAYRYMSVGDLAMEHRNNEAALRAYEKAEQLTAKTRGVASDRRAEMLYWHAVALVNMQRVEESLPLFRRAFDLHEAWRELTPRLSEAGLLPSNPRIVRRIVAVE